MLKDSDGEETGKENSASNPTQTMYQIKLQVHPTTNVLPKYDPKLMGCKSTNWAPGAIFDWRHNLFPRLHVDKYSSLWSVCLLWDPIQSQFPNE
jgi:hypothetical protein